VCCALPRCFLFTPTPSTATYPLSLHDALPICSARLESPVSISSDTSCELKNRNRSRSTSPAMPSSSSSWLFSQPRPSTSTPPARSEEHTSELQSPCNLVCRLLLEKKKKKKQTL